MACFLPVPNGIIFISLLVILKAFPLSFKTLEFKFRLVIQFSFKTVLQHYIGADPPPSITHTSTSFPIELGSFLILLKYRLLKLCIFCIVKYIVEMSNCLYRYGTFKCVVLFYHSRLIYE